MSKLVILCSRANKSADVTESRLACLANRLAPDNIDSNPPRIIKDNGIIVCIINPVASLRVENTSVCLGMLLGEHPDWWKPGAAVPDGSYAIFRTDETTVELVTDIAASRTIWYVCTDDLFIASTSQRAIISILQDFQPNQEAYSWMLFSGTLGPGLSWDKRIKSLAPDSRLNLNRSTWVLSVCSEPVTFQAENFSKKQHEVSFRRILNETFLDFDIDLHKWILPLSGGRDSRMIFLFLKNKGDLKTITWGLSSSLSDPENDAAVAQALADEYGVQHEYHVTDISDEPIELLFNRFLSAGEGRIDNVAAYLDGFKIWKHIFECGILGVIRGDEGLGDSPPVNHPRQVREYLQSQLASDYINIPSDRFGFVEQKVPLYLQQRKDETLDTWRERYLQEFRIPYGSAALNEIKCAYVEVVNPLLSRRITLQIRKMPDSIRYKSILFDNINRSLGVDMPYAKHSAIAGFGKIMTSRQIVNHVINELNTEHARKLLPSNFIDHILPNIKSLPNDHVNTRQTMKSMISPVIPKKVKQYLRKSIQPSLDYNTLAFRSYIIVKMDLMLNEDARLFGATSETSKVEQARISR